MNYKTIFLSLFIIIGVRGGPLFWGASNQVWFDTKPSHIYNWYDGFWSIRSHRWKFRCDGKKLFNDDIITLDFILCTMDVSINRRLQISRLQIVVLSDKREPLLPVSRVMRSSRVNKYIIWETIEKRSSSDFLVRYYNDINEVNFENNHL